MSEVSWEHITTYADLSQNAIPSRRQDFPRHTYRSLLCFLLKHWLPVSFPSGLSSDGPGHGKHRCPSDRVIPGWADTRDTGEGIGGPVTHRQCWLQRGSCNTPSLARTSKSWGLCPVWMRQQWNHLPQFCVEDMRNYVFYCINIQWGCGFGAQGRG